MAKKAWVWLWLWFCMVWGAGCLGRPLMALMVLSCETGDECKKVGVGRGVGI